MNERDTLPSVILQSGIVAVLRTATADDSVRIGRDLLDLGLGAVELTLTTPGALEAVRRLRAAAPAHVAVGMGTVLSGDEAEQSIAAGTSFLVTPAVIPDVVEAATPTGTPVIMGALTPTEIVAARSAGAAAVKIFPASTVGANYLRQLLGPFPDLTALPSGGVDVEDIGDWIAGGAAAVCLGGSRTVGHAREAAGSELLRGRVAAALGAVARARG